MKIARRLQVDLREDGDVIITAVPSTRFDDAPAVIKRGSTGEDDGLFALDVTVGDRVFTIDFESQTPKEGA
jgi:hypothetical protein